MQYKITNIKKVQVKIYSFFNLSATGGWVGGKCHAPAYLSLGKRRGTNCTRGWGGSQGRCEEVRKILLPPTGFDPWTDQPEA